jgi:hypothetical protein
MAKSVKASEAMEQVLENERSWFVALGDCIEKMKLLPDNSVDAVCCDPPAGIAFMGKEWDLMKREGMTELQAFQEFIFDVFTEVYRVLKPGGHAVVWALPRTSHHTAMGMERAGFDIRDNGTYLFHVFGSGFPKSLDVSKAIDKSGATDTYAFKEYLRDAVKASGKSRSQIDKECGFTMRFDISYEKDPVGWGVSIPSTDKWNKICEVLNIDPATWSSLLHRFWRGRGGELVSENVSMAGGNMKRSEKGQPIIESAKQWAGWGTALKPAVEFWILARKPMESTVAQNVLAHGTGALNIDGCRIETDDDLSPHANGKGNTGDHGVYGHYAKATPGKTAGQALGRWPAHLILDEGAAALLDKQSGESKGPSRFFYVPKAPSSEKYAAFYCECTDYKVKDVVVASSKDEQKISCPHCGKEMQKTAHPTIKSVALMEWLVKMVAPKGSVVLDPFTGSGTTGVAAVNLGCRFIGIEKEKPYCAVARHRVKNKAS